MTKSRKRKKKKLIHILPINDLKEHEQTKNCWCGPRDKDLLIIHNSLDGRERFESIAVQ